MNRRINIALVGAGYWGKNLARNLSGLKVLHSICDANSQIASSLAEQFSVPTLSYDQILQDKTVEAVMIATSASSHFVLAKAALEAGKQVFIEKPFTLNLKDARELCELANRMKKKIMVGHLLHYHPAFIKLKELTYKGLLGLIKYVYSNRLDFGKFYPNESVLWNLAPHDISMILSIMRSSPLSVMEHTEENIATINMRFPDQAQAHVFVSTLNLFKEHKLVVIGSKMMAVFDDTQQDWNKKLCVCSYKINSNGQVITALKDQEQFIDIEKSEPLRNECLHFIDCILRDKTPITDAQEAIRVMEVITKK